MAGMPKRHFQAIADVIASYGPFETQEAAIARQNIAKDLARLCQREDPQFDRERFLKACQVI